MRANNRRSVVLPSLPNVEVVIRRVSIKQLGLDAAQLLMERSNLVKVAMENASEGGQLAASVSKIQPRPTEPPKHEPESTPTDLKRLTDAALDQAMVLAGLVSPPFEKLCEAYGATQAEPERGFGPDWDFLVQAISDFSLDSTVQHTGTGGSPAQSEFFPQTMGRNAG